MNGYERAVDVFKHQLVGALHTYQAFVVGYNMEMCDQIDTSALACPAYFDDIEISNRPIPGETARDAKASYRHREQRERSLIITSAESRSVRKVRNRITQRLGTERYLDFIVRQDIERARSYVGDYPLIRLPAMDQDAVIEVTSTTTEG